MVFETVEDYIYHSARNICNSYLLPDGIYHTGYTLADVGMHYNGSSEWAEAVADIWRVIEKRAERYTHSMGA